MNHALTLNVVICLIVLVAVCVTASPMPLFGLLLLKDMPFGLIAEQMAREDMAEDEDPGYHGTNSAGFHRED
jgi:hypothetical protein